MRKAGPGPGFFAGVPLRGAGRPRPGAHARSAAYFAVPVVPGVVPVGLPIDESVLVPMEPEAAPMEPDAVEPELMSLLVPEAPMEVPLPVLAAVESVLGVAVLAVLLVVSLGDVVVEGIVLEVDVEVSVDDVADSSFLPQALSDRAAMRARAAHCAIGDLIIRNSLRFRS